MLTQIRLYCPTGFITGVIPLSKATSPVFAALIRSTIWIANLTIVSTPPIPGLIHFDTVFKKGIYEFVVKRFDSEGHLLSKERNWLIVCNGCLYQYESDDMNYQYVLYVAFLLQQKPLPAAS